MLLVSQCTCFQSSNLISSLKRRITSFLFYPSGNIDQISVDSNPVKVNTYTSENQRILKIRLKSYELKAKRSKAYSKDLTHVQHILELIIFYKSPCSSQSFFSSEKAQNMSLFSPDHKPYGHCKCQIMYKIM